MDSGRQKNQPADVRPALRRLTMKPPQVWKTPTQTPDLNKTLTYLIELDPLLRLLGAGVWNPECPELGPEEVGGVPLHSGDVEAEHLGGELRAVEEIIWGVRGWMEEEREGERTFRWSEQMKVL